MKLRITTIGSGSSGNALLIDVDNFGILIDSGFSRSELFKRLDRYSIPPEIIKNILITHGHSDHVRGARVVANTLDIATYVNRQTIEYVGGSNNFGRKIVIFNQNYQFFMYKFKIIPFGLSHDAIGTVGFLICYENVKIGFAMDLGCMSEKVIRILNGCDAIILDCNHDVKMLINDKKRPYHLKRRILSNTGHLNNRQCIGYLNKIVTNNTKHVILGHISRECNEYSKVKSLATDFFKKTGCMAEINVMHQDLITPQQMMIDIN